MSKSDFLLLQYFHIIQYTWKDYNLNSKKKKKNKAQNTATYTNNIKKNNKTN